MKNKREEDFLVNIAFDTDDVIKDYSDYNLKKGKKFFNKEPENISAYDVEEKFGVTKKERNKFWLVNLFPYIFSEIPKKRVEAIKDIENMQARIDNITARVGSTLPGVVGFVFRATHNLNWKLNKVPFNGTRVFCKDSNSKIEKAEACIDLKTDFMFEDKVENIQAILKETDNVIIFCRNRDHNKNYEFNDERVVRIDSIENKEDYMNYINELINTRRFERNSDKIKNIDKKRNEILNQEKTNKLKISPFLQTWLSDLSMDDEERIIKVAQRRTEMYEKNASKVEKSIKKRENITEKEIKSNLKRLKLTSKPLLAINNFINNPENRYELFINGVDSNVKNIKDFLNQYNDKPIIFVPTHVCMGDIEACYLILNRQMTLLSGAEERMIGTLNGFMLSNIGINYVDRVLKKDRSNSVEIMKTILKNKGDLLYFAEGTHNVSPNQLVQPISSKVIEIAKEADAYIVPIGIDYNTIDKGKIKFNISEPIENINENSLIESAKNLRDKMATLKYELYEKNPQVKRSGYSDKYWKEFMISHIEEWPQTDLLEESAYVFTTNEQRFLEEFNTKTMIKNNREIVRRI